MNYEEAKKMQEKINAENSYLSKQLQRFPKNEFGIVPDQIRETDDYKKTKKDFDESFSKLQNFNLWFMKNFKKEYSKERKNKYK